MLFVSFSLIVDLSLLCIGYVCYFGFVDYFVIDAEAFVFDAVSLI